MILKVTRETIKTKRENGKARLYTKGEVVYEAGSAECELAKQLAEPPVLAGYMRVGMRKTLGHSGFNEAYVQFEIVDIELGPNDITQEAWDEGKF